MQEPNIGGVAQQGEHLLCKQKVAGSIPVTSTNASVAQKVERETHAANCMKLTLWCGIMMLDRYSQKAENVVRFHAEAPKSLY